jgi:hypothetical protein
MFITIHKVYFYFRLLDENPFGDEQNIYLIEYYDIWI